MTRFRLYRVLCVGLTVATVLPRYWLLLLRERWSLFVPSEETWRRLHEKTAARMHFLGTHLAGFFIKACQVVGARADVFPAPFIETLSRFHDRVPPRPFARLKPFLERELGSALTDHFEHVDPEPLAAASLAQVHRARLHDGTSVVIKIQYPETRALAPVDLASIRRVAWVVGRLQRRFDIQSLVEEIAKFVALELDFSREARSTERARRELGDHRDVRVPEVYTELCSDRVLVLEFLDGVQITNLAALEDRGHRRSEVAARVARIYSSMLFEHGFFHGDPHPGNLLVLEDGRIGLLDFGLAKELPAGFADGVARLLGASFTGDAQQAIAAAEALGFEVDAKHPESLLSLLGAMLGERNEGENALDLIQRSAVRKIPEHFGLVVRTLILLNGLSHTLAPGERLVQLEMGRALLQRAA